jgi:hypothetical protein
MILWVEGHDTAPGKSIGERLCTRCDSKWPHSIKIRYYYTEFWFVVGFVSNCEYFLTCDRCGAGTQLTPGAGALVSHKQIPFRRRYGCTIVVALIALLLLIFVVTQEI